MTIEQRKDFAAQYSMKFFETYAKESINVSESYEKTAKAHKKYIFSNKSQF